MVDEIIQMSKGSLKDIIKYHGSFYFVIIKINVDMSFWNNAYFNNSNNILLSFQYYWSACLLFNTPVPN